MSIIRAFFSNFCFVFFSCAEKTRYTPRCPEYNANYSKSFIKKAQNTRIHSTKCPFYYFLSVQECRPSFPIFFCFVYFSRRAQITRYTPRCTMRIAPSTTKVFHKKAAKISNSFSKMSFLLFRTCSRMQVFFFFFSFFLFFLQSLCREKLSLLLVSRCLTSPAVKQGDYAPVQSQMCQIRLSCPEQRP